MTPTITFTTQSGVVLALSERGEFTLNGINIGSGVEEASQVLNALAVLVGMESKTPDSTQMYTMLCRLLAVIHRDGGHYLVGHGMEKAVDDALTKSADRIHLLDEAKLELDQLLEDIGGCDHEVNICACSLVRLVDDIKKANS